MKIFVAIIFYLVYWLCCFLGTGTDKKNLIGLRSYPDTVQNVVREHPEFCKIAHRFFFARDTDVCGCCTIQCRACDVVW